MISSVLIYSGLVLMVVATFLGLTEKKFLRKLHYISASDVSGSILIMVGIALGGFEARKIILAMIFLSIWNPTITHVISKAYIKRLER